MKPESAVMSTDATRKGRPQSAAITHALALVAGGATKYRAAKDSGCTASALYRALKRVNLYPETVADTQDQAQQVV